MIKVSIAIAAYNIEDYISRCLESVIAQTLKDIEIIVVNDGSTDNTLYKIKNFIKVDDRIVLVNQKNKGLIEARKSALKVAKGEYILFIDGDDWLKLNCVELLYNKAKLKDSDIVLFNSFRAFEDGRLEKYRSFEEDLDLNSDNVKKILSGEIKANIWSKFIKLDFIKSNNIKYPSNITYAEDLATTASLFLYNPVVDIEEDNLYYYFQRINSVSNIINNKVLEVSKAIRFIKEILVERNLYESYKNEFEYLVYKHLFYYRIVDSNFYVDLHKQIYDEWNNYKININKNKYFLDFTSKLNTPIKLKQNIFMKNYRLGKLFNKVLNLR